MSDNLAAAREVLATLGERDADKLVALSHPDVEWYSLFALSEKGSIAAMRERGATCAT